MDNLTVGHDNQANTSTKQPVLLQVLPALESGGVERGTVDIAIAAADAGYKSIVASAGGRLSQQLKRDGVEHITLPLASKNPWTIYKNIRKLSDLIVEHQVDIIHARSRAPAWSAFYAARNTNISFLTTFHGTYSIDSWLKKKYNSIMVKGQRIIAVSEFIRDHITANYAPEETRLRVIYRGTDLKHFNPSTVSPARVIELAKQWRIPEDRPIIMMPARLTRWKGQALLLDALAEIPKDTYYCLLVGEDQGKHPEYIEELMEKIKELNLSGSVQFVGNTSDMPAAYMLADVVVAPSIEPEAFGRVVTEAQAMERPIIAAAHGGACETIIAGETGWLFEPGDKLALAHAIKRVLSLDSEERAKYGERARLNIKNSFSLEKMIEKTLSVYQELLSPYYHTLQARPPKKSATKINTNKEVEVHG